LIKASNQNYYIEQKYAAIKNIVVESEDLESESYPFNILTKVYGDNISTWIDYFALYSRATCIGIILLINLNKLKAPITPKAGSKVLDDLADKMQEYSTISREDACYRCIELSKNMNAILNQKIENLIHAGNGGEYLKEFLKNIGNLPQ